MSNESFEEWVSNKPFHKGLAFEAWKHQQEKIDELEAIIQVMNELGLGSRTVANFEKKIDEWKNKADAWKLQYDKSIQEHSETTEFMQKKIDELEKERDNYCDLYCVAIQHSQENEILKEGLEFYAEGGTHYDSKNEWCESHDPECGTETVPSGEKARQALEKIKETNG